jgi:signal transduction histidine kinase
MMKKKQISSKSALISNSDELRIALEQSNNLTKLIRAINQIGIIRASAETTSSSLPENIAVLQLRSRQNIIIEVDTTRFTVNDVQALLEYHGPKFEGLLFKDIVEKFKMSDKDYQCLLKLVKSSFATSSDVARSFFQVMLNQVQQLTVISDGKLTQIPWKGIAYLESLNEGNIYLHQQANRDLDSSRFEQLQQITAAADKNFVAKILFNPEIDSQEFSMPELIFRHFEMVGETKRPIVYIDRHHPVFAGELKNDEAEGIAQVNNGLYFNVKINGETYFFMMFGEPLVYPEKALEQLGDLLRQLNTVNELYNAKLQAKEDEKLIHDAAKEKVAALLHDLGNKFNPAQGHLEMVMEMIEKLQGGEHSMSQTIVGEVLTHLESESIETALNIIKQMSQVSKYFGKSFKATQNFRTPVSAESYPLKSLIKSIRTEHIQGASTELLLDDNVKDNDDNDYLLHFDKAAIYAAINELYTNAIKHTKDINRDITINLKEIRLELEETSVAAVRVSIFSNGKPISPEDQVKIWDSGSKIKVKGTNKSGFSTGLGLSLVKKIALGHFPEVNNLGDQEKLFGVNATNDGNEFWIMIPKL